MPDEDYDWFEISDARGGGRNSGQSIGGYGPAANAQSAAGPEGPEPDLFNQGGEGLSLDNGLSEGTDSTGEDEPIQKALFEFAGPLHSVRISPVSSLVGVGRSKKLRAVARDKSHREVTERLTYEWKVLEGDGVLRSPEGGEAAPREFAEFVAPPEPGICKVQLRVMQGDIQKETVSVVTVTESLGATDGKGAGREGGRKGRGLPEYTFLRAPGESWRSKLDADRNLILINNGHRDFLFASRVQSLKLRYICRLFAKELVMANFPGEEPATLLERLVEVSLHVEEKLK